MVEGGWAPWEAGAKAESPLLWEEAGDTDLNGGPLSHHEDNGMVSASCPTPVWAFLGCGFSLIGA